MAVAFGVVGFAVMVCFVFAYWCYVLSWLLAVVLFGVVFRLAWRVCVWCLCCGSLGVAVAL